MLHKEYLFYRNRPRYSRKRAFRAFSEPQGPQRPCQAAPSFFDPPRAPPRRGSCSSRCSRTDPSATSSSRTSAVRRLCASRPKKILRNNFFVSLPAYISLLFCSSHVSFITHRYLQIELAQFDAVDNCCHQPVDIYRRRQLFHLMEIPMEKKGDLGRAARRCDSGLNEGSRG